MDKLPSDQASELVAEGAATRVRIGRNPAREWIGLPVQADGDGDGTNLWRDLLDEAYRYVTELQGGRS